MIDIDHNPTVIDALIGSIPPKALEQNSWVRIASSEAEEWQRTGEKPHRRNFDDVPDNML